MAKTILVVDDDQALLSSLAETLEAEGYQVWAATGWKDLLRMLNRGSLPDLILLDVMMPEFDGFELLATLKGRQDCRWIPVMVMSALGPAGRDRALEFDAVDYVAKPFDLTELLARIGQLIQTASGPILPAPSMTVAKLRAKLARAVAALAGVEKAHITVHASDPALLDVGEVRRAHVYAGSDALSRPTVIEGSSCRIGEIGITIQLRARPATDDEAAKLAGHRSAALTGPSPSSSSGIPIAE